MNLLILAFDLPGVDDLKIKGPRRKGRNLLTKVQPRRRTSFSTLHNEFALLNSSLYSYILRRIETIKKEEK